MLERYPSIAGRIDRNRIEGSVTLTWSAPPAPLIYWLWVASSDTFGGTPAAKDLLSSLELMLKLLERTRVFSGSWESRISKLLPPKRRAAGKEHLTDFRAALFEFLLAFRLLGKDVSIDFQSDSAVACDIAITSHGTGVVAVEAYAPQKAVDVWFEKGVAAPWRSLLGDNKTEHDPEWESEQVRDIFLDPASVPTAISNVLTDSNFQKQKAKQLSSGELPTLLAIRAYELIPRLENLITIKSVEALASSIPDEAWLKLPQQCLGLLLCFISDVLGEGNYMMFLPVPGRKISPEVSTYLRETGIMPQSAA